MRASASVLFALSLVVSIGGCRASSRDDAQSTPAAAASSAPSAGGFVPRRDVDAVEQPDSHRVVGHLQAGKSYVLVKRGGPGGNWCKVDVAGAAGWVLCAESEASPPAPSAASSAPAAGGGDFAYYVLTLSWSPAFCETPAGAKSPEQCAGPRRYGFVVHGLWPQNERGWPESCASSGALPPTLVRGMLDIMPSTQLVEHEWEKHGTCSGLSAGDYFARVRAAYQTIHIPDAYVAPKQRFATDLEHIVSAFTAANPRVGAEDMAVECKGELDEIRFCLDKDLAPRECGSDVRSACKGSVTVPPLR